MILAHAALIPIGHWQGDEYIEAAFAHDLGWRYLSFRLFHDSPRPLSELILYAYYAITHRLHRPVITEFLALMWMILLAGAFATIPRATGRPPWRVLLALSLLALFLLGHEVSELFFWPAGTAAYLVTLGAVTAAFFLRIDRRATGITGGTAETIVLVLAAAASEAGAMFVLALSGLRLLACFVDRPSASARGILAWCMPVAMGLFALLFVLATRAGRIDVGPPSPYLLHSLASARAAVPQLAAELAGLDAHRTDAGDVVLGLATKLSFFLGCRWCWLTLDDAPTPPPGLSILALALLCACLGMIAGGLYQFGQVCCERHGALRQCWYLLALAGLGVASTRWRAFRPPPWLAPLPLTLAILLQLPARLPGLLHDDRLYAATVAARAATWQSGLRTDDTEMQYQTEPDGRVVHAMQLPTGHYMLSAHPPWYVLGMLMLFHKQSLDLLPPRPWPP